MDSFKKKTFSFEIFPPNSQVAATALIDTLNELKGLTPDFISVTCSNNKANIETTTIKIADHVNNELQIPAVAHLPAAYLSKAQVEKILLTLKEKGINKVLALRGDIIEGIPVKKDFQYASDLVHFIKNFDGSFEVEGACYPETHPESVNRVVDFYHLKEKVDAGCDQLITQLFFDNETFYEFQERSAIAGIKAPILAGIMPVVNRNQALRLFRTSRTALPKKFVNILERYEHSPIALRDAGISFAVEQIVDLVTNNVDGIHLYTMNQSQTAITIHKATASLFDVVNQDENSFHIA
ncbi:methylenetetrahydrofolate reductase [NAD(P)H] [Erwinia sp. CPCC 100877]|nr:methylenetetrahydrofolate reductase [NAD(P)H] [Erwinia sp. CPCC 100877]